MRPHVCGRCASWLCPSANGMSVAGTHSAASVTSEHRVGSFWRSLTEQERVALTAEGTVRRFVKATVLINFAASDRWAAVLHQGRVRVIGSDGVRVIAMRSAGDIVGEQALLDRKARSATVLADTNVQALLLEPTAWERVFQRHPRILRVLCGVVSERLREADRSLAEQTDDAFTKVVLHLLRVAEKSSSSGARAVSVNIGSQEELGKLLAVSRESVVRALQRLRTEGVVLTRRGVVTIRDLGALRGEVRGNESGR
ncbi:Crp/Fnr family transcriptional regulator [Kutzneria viridogrisea]|uniref:Crp/Fnr family transcriptional regulator n=1 Tax=Kutzneria viridogrisea TaxID=47990 RepID=UPI0031F73E37